MSIYMQDWFLYSAHSHIKGLLDILNEDGGLSLVDRRGGCGHFLRRGNRQLVLLRGLRLDVERLQCLHHMCADQRTAAKAALVQHTDVEWRGIELLFRQQLQYNVHVLMRDDSLYTIHKSQLHRCSYSARGTHHIEGEHRVGEVWVVFGVLDVLGLDGDASTLKLHQRGGDLQQLETLHVSHTPAQHLRRKGGGGKGGGGEGGGGRGEGGGGGKRAHTYCLF